MSLKSRRHTLLVYLQQGQHTVAYPLGLHTAGTAHCDSTIELHPLVQLVGQFPVIIIVLQLLLQQPATSSLNKEEGMQNHGSEDGGKKPSESATIWNQSNVESRLPRPQGLLANKTS